MHTPQARGLKFAPDGSLLVCDPHILYRVPYGKSNAVVYAGGCIDKIGPCRLKEARFSSLRGIEVLDDDQVFLADFALGCIRRIKDHHVSSYMGPAHNKGDPTVGSREAVRLSAPSGIWRLGNDIYFSDIALCEDGHTQTQHLFKLDRQLDVVSQVWKFPPDCDVTVMCALESLQSLLLLFVPRPHMPPSATATATGATAAAGRQSTSMMVLSLSDPVCLHPLPLDRLRNGVLKCAVVINESNPQNPVLLGSFGGSGIHLFDIRLKRSQLVWRSKCPTMIAFHKHSNSLAIWDGETHLLWDSALDGIPVCLDLSLLISSSPNPHLQNMLTFTHALSNTTLHLQDGVLRAWGIEPSSLLNSWASSPMSIDAIYMAINYLHGVTHTGKLLKRLDSSTNSSSTSPEPDKLPGIDQLKTFCRSIHLLRSANLEVAELELMLSDHLARRNVTHAELFDLLLVIWSECDRDNNLTEMVVEVLRASPTIIHEKAEDLHRLASADPLRWTKLISMHSDKSRLYHPSSKLEQKPGNRWFFPQNVTHKFTFHWNPRDFHVPSSSTADAPPPSPIPSSFIICIEGVTGHMEVHDWLLYPQWKYFRDMLDSGLTEARTRTLTLPSEFPLSLLIAIVSTCYGTFSPPMRRKHRLWTLENGIEFGLIDGESNTAIYPFTFIIYSCVHHFTESLSQHMSTLSIFKALLRIAESHIPILDNIAINYIADNWNEFAVTYSDKLVQLPLDWMPKIFKMLVFLKEKERATF